MLQYRRPLFFFKNILFKKKNLDIFQALYHYLLIEKISDWNGNNGKKIQKPQYLQLLTSINS